MAVAVHIDCDGEGCAKRFGDGLAGYGYMTTVESVEYEYDPDERTFWVETGWIEIPEGWTAEDVRVSKRYPEGVRFRCEGCS